MKKLLICVLTFILLFTGCTKPDALNTSYLPTMLGVEKEDDTYKLTLGGYIPAKSESEPAVFESHRIDTGHILQGFRENELSCSMLCVLAVDLESAKDGLYPIYSTFVGNDEASSGVYLVLCDSVEEILDADLNEKEDLHTFLEKSDISIPTLIGYDIAMRTPAEGVIVPIVSLNDQDQFQIEQGAVFCGDAFQGFVEGELLPYIQLLNTEDIQVLLPFDTGDSSGLVQTILSCDVALHPKNERYVFEVTIFADALLVQADNATPISMERMEHEVSQSIRANCYSAIAQAKECSTDVFGFTRLIAAMDRQYDENELTQLFLDGEILINVQLSMQNLSQVQP